MSPRVLIVDDSGLMRRTLRQLLTDAGFETALACNGREALEQLQQFQPDVVTLDVNMPEMDGLTTLSLLMQLRPTPVIMVSSLTQAGAMATLEALALGAVDYLAKPGGTISLNLSSIGAELVRKVHAACHAGASVQRWARGAAAERSRVRPRPARTAVASAPPPALAAGGPGGLVLIGVSTGGPQALEAVLPRLPADFPWPVLVAQHMPAAFTAALARRLDGLCALRVRECDAPTPLVPGQILIAQGGHDLVVSERLGRLVAQPVAESPEHPWHPSVDVMVDSALRRLPAERLVGVLMTGMGNDGAASMARLQARGGRTIAESAESAVVFGMPQELIQRSAATRVLPAEGMAGQLIAWCAHHPHQEPVAWA